MKKYKIRSNILETRENLLYSLKSNYRTVTLTSIMTDLLATSFVIGMIVLFARTFSTFTLFISIPIGLVIIIALFRSSISSFKKFSEYYKSCLKID